MLHGGECDFTGEVGNGKGERIFEWQSFRTGNFREPLEADEEWKDRNQAVSNGVANLP